EWTDHVGRKHFVYTTIAHVSHRSRFWQNSGIVDERCHRTQLLVYGVEHAHNVLFDGDICGNRDRLSTISADLIPEPLSSLSIASVIDTYGVSHFRSLPHGSRTNSPGTAGYDNDLLHVADRLVGKPIPAVPTNVKANSSAEPPTSDTKDMPCNAPLPENSADVTVEG